MAAKSVFHHVQKYFRLQDLPNGNFRSTFLRSGSSQCTQVYGGLLFAQALAAAEKSVSSNLKAHAMQSMFILSPTVENSIEYHVAKLRDGQNFAHRLVTAEQHGKVVFICQVSFHKQEEAAVSHQLSFCKVPPPEDCTDLVDGIKSILNDGGEKELGGAIIKHLKVRLADWESSDKPLMEIRPVNLLEFLACKKADTTSLVWMRSRVELSDDPWINRMMLLYGTDITPVGTALRPHFSRNFVPSQVLSLNHNVWLHRHNFRADSWMLFESTSTIAIGGRAFTQERIWTRDGQLICTTAQESLIRSRGSRSYL